MKRLFVTFAAALATLLAVGCSNSTHSTDEAPVSDKAIITVAVADGARTALPDEPETSAYTSFELTGSLAGGAAQTLSPAGGWIATDDYETAYDAMQDAKLELAVGEWRFTLTATIAGNGSVCTVYKGTVAQNLTAGSQRTLTFPLSIESVGEEGTGGIAITLSVNQSVANVDSVDVVLTSADDNAVTAELTAPETGVNGVYSYSQLPVGNYIVTFIFKDADGNILGVWPEYAIVSAAGTGVSTSTVSITNLDETYTITYRDASNNGAVLSNLQPATFTRHAGVTLPVPEKEDYTFCGWYGTSAAASVDNTSASPITGFAFGTVGDKTYYAKFIADNEIAPIAAVTIDGTIKVGETVTAKAWTSYDAEVPAESVAFTGTVFSYQWFKAAAADGTYEAIEDASSASYVVQPEDAGAYLKVQVRQKYTASDSDDDDIYTIALASAEAPLVNPAVSSAAPATGAQKGTLNAASLVLTSSEAGSEAPSRLIYSEDADIVVGTALDDEELNTTSGTVQSVVANEASESETISVELSLLAPNAASVTAPAASGYLCVWLTATGYEPVQFVRAAGASAAGKGEVFINVQAATPTAGATGVPALSSEIAIIPKDTVSFTNVETNTLYEYLVSASAPTAETTGWETVPYDGMVANDGWFYAYESFEVPEGSTIYIRKAATTQAGSQTVTRGQVGYVSPSAHIPLSITAANVGTLSVIHDVTAGFTAANAQAPVQTLAAAVATATKTAKYSYKLTLTAKNTDGVDITAADGTNSALGAVSYQWYRSSGEDELEEGDELPWTLITGATTNVYTIAAADIGHYLKAAVTQTVSEVGYPGEWKTNAPVAPGALAPVHTFVETALPEAVADSWTDYFLYYDGDGTGTDNFALYRAALSAENIKISTTDFSEGTSSETAVKTSAAASVASGITAQANYLVNADTLEPVTVTYTTAEDVTTVPEGSGYVKFTAQAANYADTPVYVAIDVKSYTPTAVEIAKWLVLVTDPETGAVSENAPAYGYITFKASAETDGVQWSSNAARTDGLPVEWFTVNEAGDLNTRNKGVFDRIYIRFGTHNGYPQPAYFTETAAGEPVATSRGNDRVLYASEKLTLTDDTEAAGYEWGTGAYSKYIGRRHVSITVQLDSGDITLGTPNTAEGYSITATTGLSTDTVTGWLVDNRPLVSGSYTLPGETTAQTLTALTSTDGTVIAYASTDLKTLTFTSAAVEGNYRVTVTGERSGTTLTATALVSILSDNSGN